MLSERTMTFIMKMRDRVSAVLRRVGGAFHRSGEEAEKSERKMERASRRMARMRSVAGMLAGALAAIGGGFAAFQGVQIIAEFGDRMSAVGAVTQATNEEFARMRDLAIEMGNTTRFTAGQAAQGIEELGRAGLTAFQAMQSLPDTLALAAAGVLELGEASDITTNIMSAYSLQADEAGRVSDILAYTASNSNTDVRQLGEAFVYAGGTAGLFGVSVEETAAALGVLANQGRKASVAGSGLNTMLTIIARGGNALNDALAPLGMTSGDLVRQLDESPTGLIDVLETLSQLDMTQVTSIFGTRAGPTANALIENIDRLRQFHARMEEAEGVAQRLAFTMDNNLGGALRRLNAAWQGFVISFGQDQDGALRRFIEFMALVVRHVTDGEAGMAAIQETVENLGWSFEAVEPWIRGVAKALQVLAVAAGVALAVVALTLALKALVAVFALVLSPLGLMAVALAGGAGLLYAYRDATVETAHGTAAWGDIAVEAYNVVVEELQKVWNWGTRLFNSFRSWFSENQGTAQTWATNVGNFFKGLLNTAIAVGVSIFDVFKLAFNMMKRYAISVFEELTEILTSPIDAIRHALDGNFEAAGRSLAQTLPNGFEIGQDLANELRDGVEDIGSNFGEDYVGRIAEGVTDILDPLATYIDERTGEIMERGSARFARRLGEHVSSIQSDLEGAQQAILDAEMNLENAQLGGDQRLIAQAEANLLRAHGALQTIQTELDGTAEMMAAQNMQGLADAAERASDALFEVNSANSSFLESQDLSGFASPDEDLPVDPEAAARAEAAAQALARWEQQLTRTLASLRNEAIVLRQNAELRELYAAAGELGIDVAAREEQVTNALGRSLTNWRSLTDEQIAAMNLSAEAQREITALRDLDIATVDRQAAQAEENVRLLELETEQIERIGGLINETARERAIQTAVIEAEIEARREGVQLTYEEIEAIRARANAEYEASQQRQSFMASLRDRFAQYGEDVLNIGENMGAAFVNAFDVMADATARWATGQEVSWRKVTSQILMSIAQMIIKFLLLLAVLKLMDLVVPGSGSAMANMMGAAGSFDNFFADGAAFDAAGRIVNSPTAVRYADKAGAKTGLMGEAGPEAIMPLARTSGGKLGVRVAGGGGGSGTVNNTFAPQINLTINPSGNEEADRAAIKEAREMVEGVMDKKMADFKRQQMMSGKRLNGAL